MNTEELKEITVKGRAEALDIILKLDAEEGLNKYVSANSNEAGDCDYEWDIKKLKELFNVDDSLENSPLEKILISAELMYWDIAMKNADYNNYKSLVKKLIEQIDTNNLKVNVYGPLDCLREWTEK